MDSGRERSPLGLNPALLLGERAERAFLKPLWGFGSSQKDGGCQWPRVWGWRSLSVGPDPERAEAGPGAAQEARSGPTSPDGEGGLTAGPGERSGAQMS